MDYVGIPVESDYLAHYGRLGMKWGKHIFGDDPRWGSHGRGSGKGGTNHSGSRPSSKSIEAQVNKMVWDEMKTHKTPSPYFHEVKAKSLFGIDENDGPGDVYDYDKDSGAGKRARKKVESILSKEKDGSTGTLYADARDWTLSFNWEKDGGSIRYTDSKTGKSVDKKLLFSDEMVGQHSNWYYTKDSSLQSFNRSMKIGNKNEKNYRALLKNEISAKAKKQQAKSDLKTAKKNYKAAKKATRNAPRIFDAVDEEYVTYNQLNDVSPSKRKQAIARMYKSYDSARAKEKNIRKTAKATAKSKKR